MPQPKNLNRLSVIIKLFRELLAGKMRVLRKRLKGPASQRVALDVASGCKEDDRRLDLGFFSQELPYFMHQIYIKCCCKGCRALVDGWNQVIDSKSWRRVLPVCIVQAWI